MKIWKYGNCFKVVNILLIYFNIFEVIEKKIWLKCMNDRWLILSELGVNIRL